MEDGGVCHTATRAAFHRFDIKASSHGHIQFLAFRPRNKTIGMERC